MKIWLLGLLVLVAASVADAGRPNIVLVMTDDQGYGDFGCMGNPVIETPNLDKMAARGVRWEQFYVSPVCSPTRACLMTGRYNHRTKCIDTWLGRSMMATDETTIAEVLRDAGYATGIFGKWHLGDNYPMRPSDQGFEKSIVHRGGGMGQPSEPRDGGRRYTDPVLLHDNCEEVFKGYCTDVYFREAGKFMDKAKADRKPFFAYIACNAPHTPLHDVPEELYQHYLKKDMASIIVGTQGKKDVDNLARIAAMITNIDENMGWLFEKLKADGTYDNTIVVFLTDNGPNTRRYVRELRGKKAEVHEGGIRTPLWVQWPDQLKSASVADRVAAHIDLMPTLLDACNVDPKNLQLDGRSILPQLRNPSAPLAERPLVLQYHRGDVISRYHSVMIRKGKWKLTNPSGTQSETLPGEPQWELYDLDADPGETTNLMGEKEGVFKQLLTDYENWFEDVSATRADQPGPPAIVLDREMENPVVLTWQDRLGGKWSLNQNGWWKLNARHGGRIDVRVELPMGHKIEGNGWLCRLKIGAATYETPVSAGSEWTVFEALQIEPGEILLEASFQCLEKEPLAGYHVRIMHR